MNDELLLLLSLQSIIIIDGGRRKHIEYYGVLGYVYS